MEQVFSNRGPTLAERVLIDLNVDLADFFKMENVKGEMATFDGQYGVDIFDDSFPKLIVRFAMMPTSIITSMMKGIKP